MTQPTIVHEVLNRLETDTKESIIDAINEVNAKVLAVDSEELETAVDILGQEVGDMEDDLSDHLNSSAEHNKIYLNETRHQLEFGYNELLGCLTFEVREDV